MAPLRATESGLIPLGGETLSVTETVVADDAGGKVPDAVVPEALSGAIGVVELVELATASEDGGATALPGGGAAREPPTQPVTSAANPTSAPARNIHAVM